MQVSKVISLSLFIGLISTACSKSSDSKKDPQTVPGGNLGLASAPSERAKNASGLVSDLRKELDIIPRKKQARADIEIGTGTGTGDDKGTGTGHGDDEGDDGKPVNPGKSKEGGVFQEPGEHDCEDALGSFDKIFDALEKDSLQPVQKIIAEQDKKNLPQLFATFFQTETQNSSSMIAGSSSAHDGDDDDNDNADEAPVRALKFAEVNGGDHGDPFADAQDAFTITAEIATSTSPAVVTFVPKDKNAGLPTVEFKAGNSDTGLFATTSMKGSINEDHGQVVKTGDIDLKTDLNADLQKRVISKSFQVKSSDVTKFKGQGSIAASETSSSFLGAFTFEVGAGDQKPYLRQTSKVDVSAKSAATEIKIKEDVSFQIQKTKDNELTVTLEAKDDKGNAEKFESKIVINSDKTCKFTVGAEANVSTKN